MKIVFDRHVPWGMIDSMSTVHIAKSSTSSATSAVRAARPSAAASAAATASTRGVLAVAALLLGASSLVSSRASAQEMGQGEARITAESDVTLEVRSGPATNRERLMEIGQVVGTRMGAVKQCYAAIAKSDPSVRGKLSYLLTLGRPLKLETKVDDVGNKALASCVVKAIKGGNYGSVSGPGAAYILLEFTNSAAEGVLRTRERRAVEDAVKVEKTADGKHRAQGGTPDGKVLFTLEAKSEQATAAAYRTLRSAIPTLLDCHRKAGRRGGDPEGEVVVALTVSKKGAARVQVKKNSIANPDGTKQAEKCVQKGLGRTTFSAESAGKLDLTLHFKRERAAVRP